ncbi:MAG: CAP domain-containing protein [Flavobacteriales bacterium]|jgi:uncharacterized protein YkwD|nr:CAP domain-containing protein [Flavobacteriales bacterium]
MGQNNLFQNDLDQELKAIEGLVYHKIDSLRAKKKLKGLKVNPQLKEAAKLHVIWMKEKGKLSHIQNKSKTKTPQKRVALVGGDASFVGENVAYTLYSIELTDKKGRLYVNNSDEAIANDLVKMWRNSKGHYKNIITKGYYTTGVAIAVEKEENKVYAVQVFGGKQ